jgi:hypothetical protein
VVSLNETILYDGDDKDDLRVSSEEAKESAASRRRAREMPKQRACGMSTGTADVGDASTMALRCAIGMTQSA